MNILVKIMLTAFAAYILILLLFSLMQGTVPEPAPQPKQVIHEVQARTAAPPAIVQEVVKGPYYPLTDGERDLVERVVMAEAGAEPYEGQKAVAQCILNASQLRELSPAQVVVVLKYTKARPEPTESVKQAVSAVFDYGLTVLDKDVVYFYAPAMVTSTWHESQEYVTTIGGHRFFKEAR